MSLKKTLVGASALVMVAAAMPAAHAATPSTTLYGGGGTLAAKVYRDIFNCYSKNPYGFYSTSPGSISTATPFPATRNTACSTTSPTANAEAIGYEPVGSGAGINAFTTGNPASFGTPATSNSVAYINSSTTVGASSTPYPEVEFAGFDAYLTPTQLSAVATVTPAVSAGYLNFYEIPTLGTAITLPVGHVSGINLTVKNVCDVFSGQALVKTGAPSPQTVVVRADGSGTSFIFSNFLAQNCTGTGAQGKTYMFTSANGFPSTLPSWSVANVGSLETLVSASGSGGIAASVAGTTYAIGYVSPDYVQPIVASSVDYPASVHGFSPSVANTETHINAVPSASYGTSFTNSLASNINNLLAGTKYVNSGYPIVGFTFIGTYECYSSSYAGGLIGNAAKGAAIKAALSSILEPSGALAGTAYTILTAAGFVPQATVIQNLLSSSTGPLNASAGYGINGSKICATLH